ncbi:MAG: acyltransferase family protein [Acidimicrobiia bacterium]
MERAGFRYQPALDGLRAFAVSAVILYHLDYGWAGGGFLGVDTFFVLSGFLITSLLLRERARQGSISLSGFWARRARRLLPAVFLLLIVVVIYGSVVMNAFELDKLRGDAIASLFYVANWHFIATGQSYFDIFLQPSPLQHLWSLAIEEQFYLLWPLIVVGVMKLASGSRRALFVVIVAGIAISQLCMALLYDVNDPSRAYYGTEARAHTLLVGCLLALLLSGRLQVGPRLGRVLPMLGAIAFGIVLVAFSTASASARLFYGGDLAFSILVAIVIAASVQPTGALRSFLGLRPLRYIGRISYGLYLWHWPVIVFLTADRVGVGGNRLNVIRVAVTVVFTLASYYLLERPVLRGVLKPRLARILLPVSIVTVLVVVLVGTSAGQPASAALGRINHPAGPCGAALPKEQQEAQAKLAQIGLPPPDPRSAGLHILVVGDSRACALLTGLEVVGKTEGATVDNAAVLGCGIVADAVGKSLSIVSRSQANGCHQMVKTAQEKAIAKHRPDVIVWWSGWEVANLEVDGREVQFGTAESDALLLDRMEKMFQRLHRPGQKLVILTDAPILPTPYFPQPHPAEDAQHGHLNDLYREFAARHPGDIVIADLADKICPNLQCQEFVDGFRVRPFDGMHLSPEGAAWASQWLWPQILATLPPASTG